MVAGHKVDEKANDLSKEVDTDFLASIETLVLDQAEAFVFQNLEHVEEVLKALNKVPKKLTQLNDITRMKEIYSAKVPRNVKYESVIGTNVHSYAQLVRQDIVIQKFTNLDLQCMLDTHCSTNLFGQVKLSKVQPNRASEIAKDLKVKLTLKRLPPVNSFEHSDDSRFQSFTKTLWNGIYDDCPGYTLLLVPQYFDYVRLKNFIKQRNAQVACISEYSEKKQCQRQRALYENNEKPVLMITERALVFQKITIRFARNIVLYSIPESPDILETSIPDMMRLESWNSILKHRLNKIKN